MRQLVVVLVAAAFVVAFAPVVAGSADQGPIQLHCHEFVHGHLPFGVEANGVVSGWVSVVVDASGARKEQYHLMEQDTFSANGKSLTGVPFTFNATWR